MEPLNVALMAALLKPLVFPSRTKLFLALAVLLAAALLLLCALPYAISIERIQKEAAIKLSSLAGQQVTFSGAAREFGFPLPHFALHNVQIEGSSPGPVLLRAPRIEAELSLPALLAGRSEISCLTIVAPKIMLATDAAGRSNWRSSDSLLALFDPQRLAQNGKLPADLHVGGIKIVDGSALYTDAALNTRQQFEAVNLDLYWPDLSKRFHLRGDFLREGIPLKFSAALQRPAALFQKDISPFDLRFDTAALKAELSGEIFAAKELRMEGQLHFDSPSLDALTKWALPHIRDVPAIGPVQGSARLKFANSQLILDASTLQLGASAAQGSLSLQLQGPRPLLQATLDFDRIDLRPFLEAQIGQIGLPATSAGAKIQGAHLSALDMDLRFSAENLLLAKSTIERAALSVLTRDNRVELSLGDGQLYGGQMTGRLVTETRSPDGIKVLGTLSLRDTRIDDALREMFGIVRLTGTSDLSLNLSGEGATSQEIMSSLSGEARFLLRDGSLAGIDMAALVRKAREKPIDAFLAARTGQSTIDEASARFLITNGQAMTDNASIIGPGYRASLKGNVLLSSQSLDMTGIIGSATDEPPQPELPFAVKGPWNDPVIAPSALVQPRPALPFSPLPASQ